MAITNQQGVNLDKGKEQRKKEVLTKQTPSITRRISDAVVIKEGNPFFLSQPNGDVPLESGHGFGLYYNDCRYISGYEFRIANLKATSLVANADRGYEGFFELTNPEIQDSNNRVLISKDNIGIQWIRTIDSVGLLLKDVFNFQNFSLKEVSFPISLRFSADFEDIFAVRELLKELPGKLHPPIWQDGCLVFSYSGADGILRKATIHFEPAPISTDETTANFQISLERRGRGSLSVCIAIEESQQPEENKKKSQLPYDLHKTKINLEPSFEEWLSQHTHVDSNSFLLNEIFTRSLRDLRTLRSNIADESFFAAGIPWFATLFGRDSLITSIQTLAYNPELAAETLRLLARYQGTKVDDWRDEQPGKILHELRIGELARTNRIPHTPYYGSIDATPLFLILLGMYAEWTADLSLFEELRSNVEAALTWIDQYGDIDGDGYIEYESNSEKGLVNQGWKDSGDAIVNKDGSLGRPPIALVEIQGYVYMAKKFVADLFARMGDAARAKRLQQEASAMRKRFNQDYWMKKDGIYAMALQAKNETVSVIGSNAGYALWSGIADREKAKKTVARLMQPDVFSGWGIRTLSSSEVRYNPIGYHLGTVWPHDNSMIVAGFKQYGFHKEARRIVAGIMVAAMEFAGYRLPEVFAGFDRESYQVPVSYPVACHPQAWAAGSVPYMLTSLLGLRPKAFDNLLEIVDPMLPQFVQSARIHGLRVGNASTDLQFTLLDHQGNAGVEVLKVRGKLNVSVIGASSNRSKQKRLRRPRS